MCPDIFNSAAYLLKLKENKIRNATRIMPRCQPKNCLCAPNCSHQILLILMSKFQLYCAMAVFTLFNSQQRPIQSIIIEKAFWYALYDLSTQKTSLIIQKGSCYRKC